MKIFWSVFAAILAAGAVIAFGCSRTDDGKPTRVEPTRVEPTRADLIVWATAREESLAKLCAEEGGTESYACQELFRIHKERAAVFEAKHPDATLFESIREGADSTPTEKELADAAVVLNRRKSVTP